MKRLIAIISSVAALAGAGSAPAQTTGRIVTVDLQQIFDKYYKTPIARAKLEETRDSFNKEHTAKMDEYKKEVEELNKLREEQDRPEYTAEVREQKKKAMNEKLAETQKTQRDIEDYRRTHQKILEEQSMRMRQGILKEITDVVNKEARDAGYLLVLDKSGNSLNGVPALVYAQDNLDITDSILKILNKNAPAATEMPRPAPVPPPKPEEKK